VNKQINVDDFGRSLVDGIIKQNIEERKVDPRVMQTEERREKVRYMLVSEAFKNTSVEEKVLLEDHMTHGTHQTTKDQQIQQVEKKKDKHALFDSRGNLLQNEAI